MQKFFEDKLILIHGLEGSSQGDKAVFLRSKFPRILTPTFHGPVEDRMQYLSFLMGEEPGWTIIGSSLGGLMAVLFCANHPTQVRKMILLAPALFLQVFSGRYWDKINVPTIIYQGVHDTIVPVAQTRVLAEGVFSDLQFVQVADDHRLFSTMKQINWEALIHGP